MKQKTKKILTGTALAVGGVCISYITYKNWYIYIRDVPMGDNCWRAIFRKDGVAKICYRTKEEANRAVLNMISKYGEGFNAYLCNDGFYRIGHKELLSNLPFVIVARFSNSIMAFFK